jgi:hypothetical protein
MLAVKSLAMLAVKSLAMLAVEEKLKRKTVVFDGFFCDFAGSKRSRPYILY